MWSQRRRGIVYASSFFGALLFYTIAYRYGMLVFEGETRSLLQSFVFVVETFTTTGYGADAPWHSPQLMILVVLMQFTGIFFIFLTLPLFVAPWVRRQFEVDPPLDFDGTDHVVVAGFSPRGEILVEELDNREVEYVIVESDHERARELYDAGYSVVYGDPDETGTLEAADVGDARVVVLDMADERNATIALSVREVSEQVRVVTFVEDDRLGRYIRLAGADEVLSPKNLLGNSLADKVHSAMTTELGVTVDIGRGVNVAEFPLQRGSELDGATLAESGIRERTGAHVVGAWFQGSFVAAVDPDRRLERSTVLLVAGTESQLEDVMELTVDPDRGTSNRVVIAGNGEVGEGVRMALDQSSLDCTVVDVVDGPAVDVVGDATDAETLREANIDDADALVIALESDASTIYTTLVAREMATNVEIIGRANETESIGKLYAAGADYALALSSVAGRMLAASILDEEVLTLDTQIDIVKTDAPALGGSTLAAARIRERTNCTVVAVQRDGDLLTDLDASLRLRSSDELYVAGTDQAIDDFVRMATPGRSW
ncbi:MAG: TrkA family potassium uptake protein [Halanaeroarchaeum sp.]